MTQHKPVDWSLPLWTKETPPRKAVLKPERAIASGYSRKVLLGRVACSYTEDGRYWEHGKPDERDLQNLPADAPFDWSKPFTTRDGRKAEWTGRHDGKNRIVEITNNPAPKETWNYREDGRWFRSISAYPDYCPDDLINIPAAEPSAPPAIDWSKPVETREDPPRKVRVLCTDGPGKFPAVGLIGDNGEVEKWTARGKMWWGDSPSPRDLRNTQPEPARHTVFVNVYPPAGCDVWGSVYPTRASADDNAGSSRIACLGPLTVTEGEGL